MGGLRGKCTEIREDAICVEQIDSHRSTDFWFTLSNVNRYVIRISG